PRPGPCRSGSRKPSDSPPCAHPSPAVRALMGHSPGAAVHRRTPRPVKAKAGAAGIGNALVAWAEPSARLLRLGRLFLWRQDDATIAQIAVERGDAHQRLRGHSQFPFLADLAELDAAFTGMRADRADAEKQ